MFKKSMYKLAVAGRRFHSHWSSVNEDRLAGGGSELVLEGDVTAADFELEVAGLQALLTAMEHWHNGMGTASVDRDKQRLILHDRLKEFRGRVRYSLPGSRYEQSLPKTPQKGASQELFLKALDVMVYLWEKINADTNAPGFSPPLIMRENYTLAAFTTDLATLRNYFAAVAQAGRDLRMARGRRDELLGPLRDKMVQYRAAIAVEYGPGHSFVASLPKVYG